MAKYRNDLPQRRGGIFLTDGGMETTLIFHEGIDLPHFAAFVLLDSPGGREKLKQYYASYLAVARQHGLGFWAVLADTIARIVTIREAHEVGDHEYVAALLVDLEADLVRVRDHVLLIDLDDEERE